MYASVPSPDFSFHADEHLEVYVSASENPNHFWVQIVGNRSLQLDKLNCEMAHYYQSDSQLVSVPSELPEGCVKCLPSQTAAPLGVTPSASSVSLA